MPKVDDLILLAAPSCCGKTHFLEQASRGRVDALVAKMDLEAPMSQYLSVTPKELSGLRKATIPHMILHFALPTIPLVEGRLRQVSDDPRLGIVRSAQHVTAITMLASAKVLEARLKRRSREGLKQLAKGIAKYVSVRRRLSKLATIYGNSSALIATYEAWFLYLRSLENLTAEWLLTSDDQYELLEPSEWRCVKAIYFPAYDCPPLVKPAFTDPKS